MSYGAFLGHTAGMLNASGYQDPPAFTRLAWISMDSDVGPSRTKHSKILLLLGGKQQYH